MARAGGEPVFKFGGRGPPLRGTLFFDYHKRDSAENGD